MSETIQLDLIEREVFVLLLALNHWEKMHTMFEQHEHEQEAGQLQDKLIRARERRYRAMSDNSASDRYRYGYEALDAGHRYGFPSLDGDHEQTLQFVKRDTDDPTKFPRNDGEYPGVTCQMVLRAIADRVRYLDGQKPCVENRIILAHLQEILWQFEKRAARRHGRGYDHSPEFAMVAPICLTCGHTVCEHVDTENTDGDRP